MYVCILKFKLNIFFSPSLFPAPLGPQRLCQLYWMEFWWKVGLSYINVHNYCWFSIILCVSTPSLHPLSLLASGSDDVSVIIWNPYRRKAVATMQTGHTGNIFSVKVREQMSALSHQQQIHTLGVMNKKLSTRINRDLGAFLYCLLCPHNSNKIKLPNCITFLYSLPHSVVTVWSCQVLRIGKWDYTTSAPLKQSRYSIVLMQWSRTQFVCLLVLVCVRQIADIRPN